MVLYTYKTYKICVILDKHGNPWYGYRHLQAILKPYTGTVSSSDKVPLNKVSTKQSTREDIFVNDTGLFEMTSTSPHGRSFMKWITTLVLPDMRKRTLDTHLASLTQRLETERKEKEVMLHQFSQKFEKNEVVYILTNDGDCKNNVFKVGKTTRSNIRSRLTTYNTGASSRYYYVYIRDVYNAKRVEKGLSVYLDKFKYDPSQSDEIYRVQFDDLKEVIDMFIDSDDEIVEYMSTNQVQLFTNSVNKESTPTPIDVGKKKDVSVSASKVVVVPKDDTLSDVMVDDPDDVEEEDKTSMSGVVLSDSLTTHLNEWLSRTIQTNKYGFLSTKMLYARYVDEHPKTRVLSRELAVAVDSYMTSYSTSITTRYHYTVNQVKHQASRVYLGWVLL